MTRRVPIHLESRLGKSRSLFLSPHHAREGNSRRFPMVVPCPGRRTLETYTKADTAHAQFSPASISPVPSAVAGPGLALSEVSRGLAVGDLDGDGDALLTT